jgi:hypothetical protein
MLLKRALLTIVVCVLPVRAMAGAVNVPCSAPFVFSNAAVNAVVLPYSLPPALGSQSAAGDKLGALVQLETILSIAKFGSIGVVQLVNDARGQCSPEAVLDKLTGKRSGAREVMKAGNGLILIWGRIFQSGPDLFLQTYIRFVRPGIEESIELSVGDRTLTGALSTQAFACAPRKIALRDLEAIERQFAASRLLHTEPSSTSPTRPVSSDPFSYWITDVRGDWVKVQSMSSPTATAPFGGWMQARAPDAQWSLRRHMPELYFVEAVAGYLSARVPLNRGPAAQRALQNAETALTRYLDAWGVNAVLGSDAAAGGTPLAVAVPRQLSAFMTLMRGGASPEALAEARVQFQRAAALAPQSSAARHLVALASIAQAYRQPSADQSPQRFIEELRGLLGTDPDNTRMLGNLMAVYDLVLAPVPGAPASWALTPADREQLTKQRESLKGLLKRTS